MKISLVLVAVALFVAGANALKCYSCDDCDKATNSIECPMGSDRCGLQVLKGKKTRDCTAKLICDKVSPKCESDTQDNCSTCCDSDDCNSVGIASFNTLTMITVLLLSLLFMKQ
ncbi:uncharacterized protein LOC117124773 [Anneissia japonica]|uniref:uncharacterized protein LOC117124773 n=1 Tax=Anneissia japonica TaxID=1529436 RepID=UPI0014254D36|nr:uncharacterized protein LOC117124773 [Anneissia japonica]